MFNFKGFLTQDKNTHLEHLEDDIINRGAVGGDNALNFLKSIIQLQTFVRTTVVWLHRN